MTIFRTQGYCFIIRVVSSLKIIPMSNWMVRFGHTLKSGIFSLLQVPEPSKSYVYNIHTYITLHYITLHYIALHYITLHYIIYHTIPYHTIPLHYTTLHYTTLHSITLHNITLHYTTLHYITYIHIHKTIYTPQTMKFVDGLDTHHTQFPQECVRNYPTSSEKVALPIKPGNWKPQTINSVFIYKWWFLK